MGTAAVDPIASIKAEDVSSGWRKESRGREQDNDIDRFIIQGQDQLDKQDYQGACLAWSRVWDQFLLRLTPAMTSCDETVAIYDGSFYLNNWMQDYCAALHHQALTDDAMAKTGASFCSLVLLQFTAENDLLRENFQTSLGEFHYLAGEPSKGEKVLLDLIAERPHRSAGYAYLSDMLGNPRFNTDRETPQDLPRAIAVLEQGLAYPVEDAEDFDLEKRLDSFRETEED